MDRNTEILTAILTGIRTSNPEMADAIRNELEALRDRPPVAQWVTVDPIRNLIKALE